MKTYETTWNTGYKIIYDLATPASERRPTYIEDLDNDIKSAGVITNWSKDESEIKRYGKHVHRILKSLIDLGYSEGKKVTDELIEEYLDALCDPGDGTPNVLYLSYNGKVYINLLNNLGITKDAENVWLEDIKKAYIENGWIEEE